MSHISVPSKPSKLWSWCNWIWGNRDENLSDDLLGCPRKAEFIDYYWGHDEDPDKIEDLRCKKGVQA